MTVDTNPSPAGAWDYLQRRTRFSFRSTAPTGPLVDGKIEPSIARIGPRAGLSASPERMRRVVRDLPRLHDPSDNTL